MITISTVLEMLPLKLHMQDITRIVDWALEAVPDGSMLLDYVKSTDERTAVNALWSLTHLQKYDESRLQSLQEGLIDLLLTETNTAKKRMLLQLLREQSYDKSTLRADFLDFCLSKINSECEPYAIRCFSLYCSFKMCSLYPELLSELESHLDLLALQALSPGLKRALRTTRKRVASLKRRNV